MPKKSKRRSIRPWEVSAILLVIIAVTLLALPVVRANLAAAKPRLCGDNLRQWGQILALYRNEHIFHDPPVHGAESLDENGLWDGCDGVNPNFNFIPDMRLIYPEYTTDNGILACPQSPLRDPGLTVGGIVIVPERMTNDTLGLARSSRSSNCDHPGVATNGDVSYTYLGYMIDAAGGDAPYITEDLARAHGIPYTGPSQIVAVLLHLASDPVRGVDPRFNDVALKNYFAELGPNHLQARNRLLVDDPNWQYIQRHYFGSTFDETGGTPLGEPSYRDWHANVPAMWDTIYQDANGDPIFAHESPRGLNVLYLDGHVEFVEYPSKFPASEAFATMRRIQ